LGWGKHGEIHGKMIHSIGLRENLQETTIFHGKNIGFPHIFPETKIQRKMEMTGKNMERIWEPMVRGWEHGEI